MAAPRFDPGRVVQVYAPGRPAGERNVGAMRRHAATPAGDLPARVRAFADEPAAARFAPVHLVLDEYGERAQDGERLPMDPVRADTLAALARDVFHVPASSLERLNPGVDRGAALAAGAEVRVPDPGFAPLLAGRPAAEVVSAPLDPPVRVALLSRLVPVAAPNPTAVDAVLGRLALAFPTDAAAAHADALMRVAARVRTVEPASGFEVAGYA